MVRKIVEKKIIGLDLDGVILDHSENKIRLAKQFGVHLAVKDTPASIMEYKMNPVLYGTIKTMLYDDPSVCSATPLMHGAEKGLDFLKSKGIPFYLISRRAGPSALPILSLKKHGLWGKYFDYKNAFFVKEKADKNVLANKLGVEVFLDDEPSVLDVMSSVHDKYLFDPVRAYHDIKSEYQIVNSWKEFILKAVS